MKTIYLLRHGDAESAASYDDDHDRQLTEQGRRAMRRLGQFMAATGQVPDRFVTSTAVRARQTVEALMNGDAELADLPLRASHALYQAEPVDVLEEIQTTGTEAQSVLLVGHQPAWSTAVSQFVGTAHVSLPPGTCAQIDVPADQWADVAFGSGVLRWLLPPRLFWASGAL